MMRMEGELGDVAVASAHEIVWEFDRDYIRGHMDCRAPEGADCRLGAADWNVCHCEQWNIEHDEDGPFHIPEGGDEKHRMKDSGECQFVLFMDNSDSLPEDNVVEHDQFEIGRTPVTPEWQGDFYGWKRATA